MEKSVMKIKVRKEKGKRYLILFTTHCFTFAVVGNSVDPTDCSTTSANMFVKDSKVSEFFTAANQTAK